jgi:hypothetical protein
LAYLGRAFHHCIKKNYDFARRDICAAGNSLRFTAAAGNLCSPS